MNTTRLAIRAAALIIASTLIRPIAIHAQDDENDSIHDELRIMTRILESTLGDAIDPSAHRLLGSVKVLGSMFDNRISAEYIPTVGAIITIPVRFPLRPSGHETSPEPESVEDADLWEHFSDKKVKTAATAAPTVPIVPQVPPVKPVELDVAMKILGGLTRDNEIRYKEAARNYSLALSPLVMMFGSSEPYDPVKVSTLTHSVVETIARYGLRLSQLPNSERLLVILEARRPASGFKWNVSVGDNNRGSRQRELKSELRALADVELRTKERLRGLERRARDLEQQAQQLERLAETSELRTEHLALEAEHSALEAAHDALEAEYEALEEGQEEVEIHLELRVGDNNRRLIQQDIGGGRDFDFWIPPIGVQHETARDRRLLSFKKSDLTKELTYDQIKGKVDQIDY